MFLVVYTGKKSTKYEIGELGGYGLYETLEDAHNALPYDANILLEGVMEDIPEDSYGICEMNVGAQIRGCLDIVYSRKYDKQNRRNKRALLRDSVQ